jgi:hypothetical protein
MFVRGQRAGRGPGFSMRAALLLAPLTFATVFFATPAFATPNDVRAVGATPAEVLARAFANRFEIDMIADLELHMRDGTGQETRRLLKGMSRIIDGHVHTLGQITWPDRLRGVTVLTIEAGARSHDAFVYLPAAQRVRRVSTAQRGEAFFGTDVTYEDLERRRVDDFALGSASSGQYQGEPVLRIRAKTVADLTYDRVQFAIAEIDGAILEMLYYMGDDTDPYRRVRAPRADMVSIADHVLPTRLIVENLSLGRVTEVRYHALKLDPVLDARIFSVTMLGRDRDLPGSKDVAGLTAEAAPAQ